VGKMFKCALENFQFLTNCFSYGL